MKSINPMNGNLLKEYQKHSNEEISNLIDQSHSAFLDWRESSFSSRSKVLIKTREVLLERKEKLAELIADEVGKPISEGVSEIEKCSWVCEYYAKNAESFLSPRNVDTEYTQSEIHFSPIGSVLAVMPWNYPFWQVFRFLAPTLMAGNTALLKHASNVTGCALEIEKILRDSGLPKYTFISLLADKDQIENVIENPKVRAVTLTGSTGAGKSVAKIAGANLKKTVLELGGSDAYIILSDANIEEAAKLCTQSRLLNAGQSCISAKRFIVMSDVHDLFVERLKTEMEAKKMGHPKDSETDLGPMARVDLRDELHNQVEASLSQGAKCILGGEIPEREGAFYPPTILTEVSKGMPAYSEELFGPVASVIRVESLDEAVSVANDTSFGLGSGIFTKNTSLALKTASEKIDAGACFINDFVKSDPRLPFGGVKESGYGRELAQFGIHEFVNIKTVCIK